MRALLLIAALALGGCVKALCPFEWVYTGSQTHTEVCMGGKCVIVETTGQMCKPVDGVIDSTSGKSRGPNPADVPPLSDTLYTEAR